MDAEGTGRRLAAIMFTDIVGYTALMASSEPRGHRVRARQREVLKPLVERYGGEWVQHTGDETLCAFPSAVDAANCALAIQAATRDEPDLCVRIGIHLGDVVAREGGLHGDGTNIAARIRPLAEPGGVCVSDEVAQAIRSQENLRTKPLGTHDLKNVGRPVAVHVLEGEVVAPGARPRPRRVATRAVVAVAGMAVVALAAVAYLVFGGRALAPAGAPLTSIAVLPFDDMSPGGDQTWLANGMAEELIESLSRIEALRVIARTSSFSVQGADVATIGAKLHVGSVVEGSVRRSGDELRLTAQLIRVADGSHLWSARYDRKLDDVFAAQTELAREIAEAIRTELGIEDSWLGLSEARYVPRDVRAWELVRRGSELSILSDFAEETLRQAGKLYQDAIEIDPGFSVAHTFLGWNHYLLWLFGHDRSDQRLERARVSQQQALELDPSNPGAHEFFAHRSIIEGDLEGAERRLARAIEARPRDSGLRVRYAEVLAHTGRLEEALVQAELAAELDPLFFFPQETLAYMHLLAGNYDSAIQKAELALELNQATRATWTLAMAYHRKGMDGAGLEAVLRYLPKEYEAPLRTGFDERGWRGWNLAVTDVIAKTTGSPCGDPHPFQGARAYARAGEAGAMYRCLDEEIAFFGDWRLGLKVDPEWDSYRDDPRFTSLLRRVNLAE